MAITITLASPLNKLGPGMWLFVQSTFIGPLPVDEVWSVTISTDSAGGNALLLRDNTLLGNRSGEFVQIAAHAPNFATNLRSGFEVAPNTLVWCTVEMLHGGAVVDDVGSIQAQWDPTTALWRQVLAVAANGGGLSSADRVTLNAIKAAVTKTYTNP